MDLPRSLLKDFAEVTNDSSSGSANNRYVRGTVKVSGETKYVQIDGSSSLTPISEVVDVQEDDRVLVSIENHKATILGNFTFPPSARKEQEAIDKAEGAQSTADSANTNSNLAMQKAQDAQENADKAISDAETASSLAAEAKDEAADAMVAAGTASTNAQEAKEAATGAAQDATTARQEAAAAQSAVANANAEITKINGEITAVKGDIDTALGDLADQADEIEATKETLELNYAKKTDVSTVEANLKTEISKKVGELQTTVEQNYAGKTDVVDLEGRLQTQITQNQESISSTATKVEKLESDTTEAQKQVDAALEKAAAAQTAATDAQSKATAAQTAADEAKANATTAAGKADAAQTAADAAQAKADAADKAVQTAQGDLNEAKQNLANVTNRVGATEQEIAEAQTKVDAAQEAVNNALADAAEANLAASNAQAAADQAALDAAQAQTDASNAQLKADNAQAVADKAQADASKAQADVAALTKRVTTAETNISQNAEQIALTATKTEEIGDKLINDYYTKTQTDAQIKLESDEIRLTVSSIQEKVEGFKIGGRNLLLNSSFHENIDQWTSRNTLDMSFVEYKGKQCTKVDGVIGSYDYVRQSILGKLEPDTQYTASAWVLAENIVEGDTNFCLWWAYHSGKYGPNNSFFSYGHVDIPVNAGEGEWQRVTWTFTTDNEGKVTSATESWMYVYFRDYTGQVYFSEVQLEKGSLATDWTPAPEDIQDGIDNAQSTADEANSTASAVDGRVTITESEIQQLAESISMLVTDGDGNSMMTQTSDGWRFDISSITDNLDAAKDQLNDLSGAVSDVDQTIQNVKDLANDLAEKTAYIVMTTDDSGDPCIELGKSDNDFKLRITNESIDFMDGSSRIAYVSNQMLYITKAVIKDELQIGEGSGYVWKKRSNGNMGLRYVGG